MSDGEPQQSNWEKETGLNEDTTYVVLYPARSHADEWMEEAKEQGYGSRSKYLYELIQEARAFRQEGFLAHNRNESEVEELEAEVARLKEELAEERQQGTGEVPIPDDAFVTAFLTDRYKRTGQILKDVTSSGALTGVIKDSVEDQLYDLAERGVVEFKQGHGWRLTGNGAQEAMA